MFSWKPIYIELAQKLLAYRDKQGELLTWLQDMKQAALPAISVTDFKPEGTAITLLEIDPFTFFANFNRGIKNEHRVEILRILKSKMGLVSRTAGRLRRNTSGQLPESMVLSRKLTNAIQIPSLYCGTSLKTW